jgi:hypothetical protein
LHDPPPFHQALDEVHVREEAQRQAWREEQRRREEEEYVVGGSRGWVVVCGGW